MGEVKHVLCYSASGVKHKSFRDARVTAWHYPLMSTAQKIGARLKQAREERELTLQGLADLTRGKLIASRLGNYEQGTRLLKPHTAILLAPLLRKSAAWLLCVDEESTLEPDERALLDIYRATDDRGKSNIRSIAELQPDVNSRPERAA